MDEAQRGATTPRLSAWIAQWGRLDPRCCHHRILNPDLALLEPRQRRLGHDRSRQGDALEQLARDGLRTPITQERLRRTDDGRVSLTLKAGWSDGKTALLFEPVELLERLTALTPRPRINLVLHHGVLAPHSR